MCLYVKICKLHGCCILMGESLERKREAIEGGDARRAEPPDEKG